MAKEMESTIGSYNLERDKRVVVKEFSPFLTFKITDYEITPITANHDAKSYPVIFSITKGKAKLLYAHDTGYFTEEAWN